MLKREGVTVELDPSQEQEQRDLAGMTQAVIATMVAKGALTAIEAAYAKFRKHMSDRGEEVTVEDEDLEE